MQVNQQQANLTKQQCIQYLRQQAGFIEQLADDIEKGVEPQYWTVDLKIPEYEKEQVSNVVYNGSGHHRLLHKSTRVG